MNRCDYYQDLISRLVDGEVSREEYEDLMEHMKDCSRCNATYAVFHDLSEILRSEEPEPLPEGLHESIMAGVRRSALEKKNRRMRTVWVRTALTAAACAVLVLFASRGIHLSSKTEELIIKNSEEIQTAAAAEPAAPAGEATAAPAAAEEAEETAGAAGNSTERAFDESPAPSTDTAAPAETKESFDVPEYEIPSPTPTSVSAAKPAAAATPAPQNNQKQEPSSTPVPETPVPKNTGTPVPKATETPAPKATETPTPKATETPAPKATETPAPKATETPTPKATEPPTPKATEPLVPETAAAAAPQTTGTPSPDESSTPAPKSTAGTDPTEESGDEKEAEAEAKPETRKGTSGQDTDAVSASDGSGEKTEEPAATPEITPAPKSVRGSLRSMMRVPALATVSPQAEETGEGNAADQPDGAAAPSATPTPSAAPSATPTPSAAPSATPTPSAAPSATPTPSATPSATPSPAASTKPQKSSLRLSGEKKQNQLRELLGGTEEALPESEEDSILTVTLVPEDPYAGEKELVIRFYGEDVFFETILTESERKSYRADCTAQELRSLVRELRAESETAPEKPEASPTATADPFPPEEMK